MADFDPSFNPDYNPDKPAKETKQASGFNANFNPDYNPDAGVVDEAPPAEPTDPWLKSLTGTSVGSAGVFSGSKNAAQLQADFINKKRGTNEALNVVARLNKGTAGTLRNVAAAAAEAGDLVGYTATQLMQPALGPQSFQTSIENIKQYRGEGGIGEGIRKATKRMDEFIEEGTKARVPMFTKNDKGGHDFNWKEYGNYWDMLVENAPQLAVQYGAGARAFQNAVNAGRSVDEAAAIAGKMSGRIEGAQLFGDAMDAANKKGVPLVKAVPVSAAVALVGTAISSGVPGGKKISSVLKKGEPGAIKTAIADMADKGLEGIFFKKAHEIAESTTGIKGRLARFALSGAKEATEEGLQEVASIAGESTYDPEAWKDAWPRIAQSAIGGLVIGAPGGLFVAPRADTNGLQGIYNTDPKKFTDPIDTTSLDRANAELKAMADRMRSEGNMDAAAEVEAKSEQLATAKTKGEAAEIVNPFAALGKLGNEFSSNLASAMDAATRSNAPESVDSIKAIQTDVEDLLARRRSLIDALNAQENEAADIEDIDVADKMIREIKREKGRVEKSINAELKTLNERVKSEFSGLVEQVSDQTVKTILKETSDAAQAREVGQDRVTERQQVGEGGLPTEAGSGDQLAEGGKVQQEEVATPNQDQLPANNAPTVTGAQPTLTDIVSPAQNDVQSTAFEAAKEQIRKDETLTPQQKNEAIRKAYDRAKSEDSFKTYHGSGVSGIKQFDLRFAGSGEGVAEQGHGLYMSSDPKVAEYFRDSIAEMGGEAADTRTIGAVYDVDVRGNERSFLDLDKKVSEQTSGVKRNLMKTAKEFTANVTDDMTGLQAYKEIAHTIRESLGDSVEYSEASKMASDALSRNGIPGNKYLEENTSDNSGLSGTSYVLFDPSTATITSEKDGFGRTKAVLKEIGSINRVRDITQMVADFYKLTDAIVRDLASMGKAKFENYWNKFKEYVDEGTLKHVEERYGWEARNAYAEALESIRDSNVEDAGSRNAQQEPTYRPSSFFAEGLDGIRAREASLADGRTGVAAANAAGGFQGLIDAVKFGSDHQTHVDENGMGTIYVREGDSVFGSSENGGFFKVTDYGDGRVELDGITGPAGHGLATMAAAASIAKNVYGATEVGGVITSPGAWLRRGLYPSTTLELVSPEYQRTSVDDMIGKVVDPNISPDVLVHSFNLMQNGDNLGAALAWNVARGTTGDVDFMAAGLDPFRAADDMIRAINAEKGYNRQTLSQALGIDFNSATPGDYYWGIMRAIKKLGSTVGDTSLKIRTKFNLSADVSKEIAKQIHEYKDVSKIKAVPDSMQYKKADGMDRFIHLTEGTFEDISKVMDFRDVAIAKGVERYKAKYFDFSSLRHKGDPSGSYKYSPQLWGPAPAPITMRDSSLRRVYDVGKAFVARIEKTKYNAREGIKLASELDQDVDLSRAVQQALVHGTLWEYKDENGNVIGQGKTLTESETRNIVSKFLEKKPHLIDKAVESYNAMRGHMDSLSDEIKKALKYQHDVHVAKLNDALKVERDPKLRSQMRGEIQDLNKNFKDMMRSTFGNAAYWPLIRLGKHKVDILDIKGNRLATCFVENTDHTSLEEAAYEAGWDDDNLKKIIKSKEYTFSKTEAIKDKSEARALGGAIFDSSMAAWLSQATSLDPEYAATMRELIAAASVGDSFRQRTKHRSGIPGWTHKAGATFQHLVNTSSNMIANAYHAHEFSGALEGMNQSVRGEDYDPNLEAYARDYVNDVRNPPFSNWASNLTAASYAWELMANNQFGVVNKLQPWQVATPRLGAMYGYRKAARVMGTAENLVWRHTVTQLGFGSFEDLAPQEAQNIIERLSDPKNFKSYKNPTLIAENVRYTLMQSLESGELRPSLNDFMRAASDSPLYNKLGAIRDQVTEKMGILQSRTEQMNRIQTIIAGAILGSEHGVMHFDNDGMYNTGDRSKESVARFAEYINDITNMTSGRANSPLTSRMSGGFNGVGRIIFQYKRMLFDMALSMHNLGLMKARGADSNAKAVWEYAKPWMAEMAASAVMAGPKASILGYGLYTGAKALISAICAAWDWPEEEVFNAASDRVVEVWSNFYQTQLGMSKENADDLGRRSLFTMLHGATNANGYGFDISNSVTPQLMMIPNNAKPLEAFGSIAGGAIGSRIAGISEQFWKYGFTKEGFAAAGQKATPRAFQGAAEVLGLKDTQVGEAKGFEKAIRFAGFHPTKQAMNQDILSNKFELKGDREKLLTNLRKKQENIYKLDTEDGVNNDKKIDKLREEIESEITKHNLRVEKSKVGDKTMKINYARDIKPFGNVEKQRQRNEDLEEWQK